MTTDTRDAGEPDWDTPLPLTLTPALIIHAIMGTASAVHTGWSSCIDKAMVIESVRLIEKRGGKSGDWHAPA